MSRPDSRPAPGSRSTYFFPPTLPTRRRDVMAPGPTAQGHPRWTRIVAVANQKGGVGKTTTSLNLGAALADMGRAVVIVDLDPQGNATAGVGIDRTAVRTTSYDVVMGEAGAEEAIMASPVNGLWVVPATVDLAGAEIELVSRPGRERCLAQALSPLRGAFDFVLLDCPPSLGLLTVNALTAADEVLVPIQCEYFALEGLGHLMENVRLVQQRVNPRLALSGILLTMFDARTKLAEQVVEEVRRYFGPWVYEVVIPRSVRLSEAPGFGLPITTFDPSSRGAEAYRTLAREVVSRPAVAGAGLHDLGSGIRGASTRSPVAVPAGGKGRVWR